MGTCSSRYLAHLLRHHPEKAHLEMNIHGWVRVDQLIENLCAIERPIDMALLEDIVAHNEKRRFRFDEEKKKIKACQGHTIPWVVPELTYPEPPKVLYHGTSAPAWQKIQASCAIKRMERHAVHMHGDPEVAWQSGERWHLGAVLLEIDARALKQDGFSLGVTENDVWCSEIVPIHYIIKAHTRCSAL